MEATMMRRAAMWAAAFGLLAAAGAAQETTDKQALQYSWKKGERFTFRSRYAMSVKLDKVPEVLQGVLSEEPAALKLDALLDVEVKEVAENGTALLEGQWKTLSAKGHVMVNDVDFDYDAAKKPADKPEKKPEAAPQDALPGLPNLEDQFRGAVSQPLKLRADRRGRITIEGGAKSREGIEWLFGSMNGLMGALPEGPVGRGEKWKDQFKPTLPGAGAILDVKAAVESSVTGEEKAGDASCVVIQSKYSMGGGGEKKDGDPALAFKMKTSGEGEGKTLFDAKAGRLSSCRHALKSRVEAEIPNPGGGDAIDLKATVKIEQSNEVGR
jgi:hypothetical protein